MKFAHTHTYTHTYTHTHTHTHTYTNSLCVVCVVSVVQFAREYDINAGIASC